MGREIFVKKLILFLGILCFGVGILCVVQFNTVESAQILDNTHPTATIELDTGETLKVILYPENAPNTVKNFIYLANSHFYDNMSFSRLIPNYLIQTGDPLYNGFGFPGYFIKSECKANGYKNHLKHKRGTLSMARSDLFNTEGSQFFILLRDDTSLDGQYAAFGQVVEGLENLEKRITQANNDLPKVKIRTITIETFGEKYDQPVVLSVEEQRHLSALNE